MGRRSLLAKAASLAAGMMLFADVRLGVGTVGLSDSPTQTGRGTPERASRSVSPNDERLVRLYAYQMIEGKKQRAAFIEIVRRESSFSHTATNESNGRYGFAQALPDDYESAGVKDYLTNGVGQLNWMLAYIEHRYGTPVAALAHHDSEGWY